MEELETESNFGESDDEHEHDRVAVVQSVRFAFGNAEEKKQTFHVSDESLQQLFAEAHSAGCGLVWASKYAPTDMANLGEHDFKVFVTPKSDLWFLDDVADALTGDVVLVLRDERDQDDDADDGNDDDDENKDDDDTSCSEAKEDEQHAPTFAKVTRVREDDFWESEDEKQPEYSSLIELPRVVHLAAQHGAVVVWDYDDAPDDIRAVTSQGGDENWVAFLPTCVKDNSWRLFESGSSFGCHGVARYQVDQLGELRCGYH